MTEPCNGNLFQKLAPNRTQLYSVQVFLYQKLSDRTILVTCIGASFLYIFSWARVVPIMLEILVSYLPHHSITLCCYTASRAYTHVMWHISSNDRNPRIATRFITLQQFTMAQPAAFRLSVGLQYRQCSLLAPVSPAFILRDPRESLTLDSCMYAVDLITSAGHTTMNPPRWLTTRTDSIMSICTSRPRRKSSSP